MKYVVQAAAILVIGGAIVNAALLPDPPYKSRLKAMLPRGFPENRVEIQEGSLIHELNEEPSRQTTPKQEVREHVCAIYAGSEAGYKEGKAEEAWEIVEETTPLEDGDTTPEVEPAGGVRKL